MARTPVYSTPNVYIRETDLTEVTPVPGISTGAIVGRAKKGPVNALTLIRSEQELIDTFGTPIINGVDDHRKVANDVDYGLYAGIEFLKESNALYYVRVTDGSEIYSSVDFYTSGSVVGSPLSSITSADWKNYPLNYDIPVKTTPSSSVSAYPTSAYTENTNLKDYKNGNTLDKIADLDNSEANPNALFRVFYRSPGSEGNNYAISLSTSAIASVSALSGSGPYALNWKTRYDIDPTAQTAVWGKVFRLNLYKKQDTQTWTKETFSRLSGSPIESYLVSRDPMARDASGNSLYIEDVINGVSPTIYVNDSTQLSTLLPAPVLAAYLSGGGFNSGSWTTSAGAFNQTTYAWRFFRNRDYSAINIALFTSKDSTDLNSNVGWVNDLMSYRRDFIAVMNVPTLRTNNSYDALELQDVYFDTLTYPSYVAKYAGMDLIYDRYNATKLYIPKSIMAAAIMARVDAGVGSWEAPAGLARGRIASLKQLYVYDNDEIGKLYDLNINTSRQVLGSGNFLWGQKTAQRRDTVMNRINVRRLFLQIENRLERELLNYLFTGNNERTRSKVSTMISSYLSSIQLAGGINEFGVVCNKSNNTDSSNTLNVDVYIRPTETIEFIQLQMVATKEGVTFTEA
jgi:hypothetical protein